MDNLSPELNRIVDLSNDPLETINLREAIVGEKITVILGENSNQRVIVFQVIKPAGPGWGEDATEATIVDCFFRLEDEASFRKFNLPFPPIGLKAFLVGACTKNPEAPLGITMFNVHRISRDRHFMWSVPKPHSKKKSGEITWIFPETVTNILRA